MNPQIKDAAQQYLKAANLLHSEGAYSGVLLPLIVNAAFSVELFLKAANSSDIYSLVTEDDCYLITAKSNKGGHIFIDLFQKLSDYIQQDMSDKYLAQVGGNLEEMLQKYSETFVKFRYIFEDSTSISTMNLSELLALMNFLGSYAENT